MFEVDSWEYGKNRQYNKVFKEPTHKSISVISGITQNNGTNYYTEDKLSQDEIFEGELTISTRGEYSGTVFYHSEKFVLANNILVMKMPSLSKNQKIFIGGLINSLPYGGYSGYPRKETLKQDKIQLPTKNGEIDFPFMEAFISELEALRIAELEAYLRATGLNDFSLNVKEKQVLADFESGKFEWGEFRIGELFEINSSKKRFDANKVEIEEVGEPYVVRTALNNGIRGYINEEKEFLNQGNTISFGQDTATMFYQEKPYFTGDKIKIVESRSDKFNKITAHFFITTMTKSFSSFSWGSSSFNVKIINDQSLKLPTQNNEPNYELMETLISAIQKIVIKDVVEYADRKIEATRKVVGKGN